MHKIYASGTILYRGSTLLAVLIVQPLILMITESRTGLGSLRAGLHITLHQNTLTNCIPLFDFLSCYSSLLCFVLLTKAIVYSFFCYVKSFSVKYFPNVFQNILFLSSAAEFIFLSTSTRTRIISSDFFSNYNSAGFLLL